MTPKAFTRRMFRQAVRAIEAEQKTGRQIIAEIRACKTVQEVERWIEAEDFRRPLTSPSRRRKSSEPPRPNEIEAELWTLREGEKL